MRLHWAALDLHPHRVAGARSLLPRPERERADDLASPAARRRWIVARAVLRCVLARHLGVSPRRLEFERDRHGRPRLRAPGWRERDDRRSRPLVFSLAHSHELALIAVGRVPRLGVDLELVRPLAALDPLARRCLAPRERAALGAVAPPDRPRALLRCWTRKEAYLKALGIGLSLDPRGVEVGLGETPTLRLADSSRGSGNWRLVDLEPEPGYVAALVLKGRRLNGRRRGTRGRPRTDAHP